MISSVRRPPECEYRLQCGANEASKRSNRAILFASFCWRPATTSSCTIVKQASVSVSRYLRKVRASCKTTSSTAVAESQQEIYRVHRARMRRSRSQELLSGHHEFRTECGSTCSNHAHGRSRLCRRHHCIPVRYADEPVFTAEMISKQVSSST